MKKMIFLSLAAVFLEGCAAEPQPQPVYVIDRRPVYHNYRSTTVERRSSKAAPSVSGESAESFRAVEQPSSYSQ